MSGKDKKVKKVMIREFLENFTIGGSFVVLAIWIAQISSPAIGGIIAALPIRYGITWTITALREGKDFAEDMARGSLIGMPGNLAFSIMLYVLLITSMGLIAAFMLAVIAGFIVIIAMKLTFPE